jgi:hypothetical protein
MALAAVLSGLLIAAAVPAQGASRNCRKLEAELALSSHRNVRPASVKAYDKAIDRQSQQIVATRERARKAGCGFSLFSGNIRQCAMLNAALQRMSANLDSLQRKRRILVNRHERRSPSHILAQLEARGCRGKPKQNRLIVEGTEKSSEAQMVSAAAPAPLLENEGGHIVVRPHAYGSGSGEFRTLCVRTCDGYFFPMSNAAALSDFQRDQANCESACPGTQMQLFYQRGISGDPSAMLSSATGRPYGDLPSAFLYKRPNAKRPAACGCNPARNFSILGGTPSGGYETAPNAPSVSYPVQPASGKNPASIEPQAQDGTVNLPHNPPSGDRKIRVVGPRFLPDPAGTIDLRAPARTPAR